jgi:hypothetical protein
MYNIAVNPAQGLYTKAQFKRGDIPTPGTRGVAADADAGGITKEFVSVKFTATANRLNGELVTIDADGVATRGTVAEGGLLQVGKRAGILTYNASAVATQTMTGTHFGWAQVWGKGKALVTGTATASSAAMVEPAADGAVDDGAMASASANLVGLNWAVASTFPPGLADVFIDYPRYIAGDL